MAVTSCVSAASSAGRYEVGCRSRLWGQRDVQGRAEYPPIGICSVVVSQVIDVDDEPYLLIVQHTLDALAVVVVALSLMISESAEAKCFVFNTHHHPETRQTVERDLS